jgi:hypothetical protein
VERFPSILIGNKCDLEDQRVVTQDQARALAKKWDCSFMEVSTHPSHPHLSLTS